MKREEIDVRDDIMGLQILTERVRVLSSDLTQEYFGLCLNGEEGSWKISGSYYHDASIKMEMIFSMVVDIDEDLKKIQRCFKKA